MTETATTDTAQPNGNGNGHDDALLVFMPSGRRGRFPLGTPVLQAARQLGVDIDSVCGGRGICGRCQVVVSEGEFAKLGVTSRGDHMSDFSAVEQRYGDKRGMKPGRRLSCQAQLLGDLVIDVPADSQVHKQVVRKRAEMRDITLDPIVRLYYVEVQEPDMHDPTGDLQRLEKALSAQWQLTDLDTDLRVIQGLQEALRKGGWKVTVAVHMGKQITAVWPGFHDKAYGLAVDIGSTTIAGHLCDLSTGDVIAECPTGGVAEVNAAVEAAQAAFPAWRDTPPVERARVFFKYRQLVEANFDKLCQTVSREHGKTNAEARGSVFRGLENIEYACGIPTLLFGDSLRNIARGEAYALDTQDPEPQWRTLAAMPPGFERGSAAVVVAPPRVYLFGGAGTNNALATNLYYDSLADMWSQVTPDLPAPRSHPAGMRRVDGTFVVTGGLATLDSNT